MSLRPKELSTPFNVRVIAGRFEGVVGTAVALFDDGVYVIHRYFEHYAFAAESEIERLDK